jgi:hypothetical protein
MRTTQTNTCKEPPSLFLQASWVVHIHRPNKPALRDSSFAYDRQMMIVCQKLGNDRRLTSSSHIMRWWHNRPSINSTAIWAWSQSPWFWFWVSFCQRKQEIVSLLFWCLRVLVCLCAYICIYKDIHPVHMYICTYVRKFVCVYVCTCVYIFMSTYIPCICVCTCVYIYIYIHIWSTFPYLLYTKCVLKT